MRTGSAILIRADANPQMGTGHVMRCMALAQAWQDAGGKAVFAACALPAGIRARLEREQMDVVVLADGRSELQDAQQASKVALRLQADWVVADGYGFGEAYQRAIQAAGLKLLLLDDYGHARHYSANLVLNQNASADESLYASRERGTRLLLGARYALLRREFLAWRELKREVPEMVRTVLVTMGGADPDNASGGIVRALAQVAPAGWRVKIVAGPANPNSGALRHEVENCGRDFELISGGADMPRLMAWADLAISAAGSTLWELMFMQVPTLAVCLAENQRANAEKLRAEAGMLVHHFQNDLCDLTADFLPLALSQSARARLAAKGREIVDGEGAARVVASMVDWN
jgi:UDP-2,4-diacetamido-2,4,6-trideoxy-beta-L-altropyranose hydrolase